MAENKKLALLRILEILEKYSDADHPLTYAEIEKRLADEYDLTIERKAIARNLSLLREAGRDVQSDPRRGVYLEGRTFTDGELHMLIDNVLSSKYISARYSKELIEKISTLSTVMFRGEVQAALQAVVKWDKTEDKTLFLNVERVHEAIKLCRQISFDYNKYGADKKLHRTASHLASPYRLIVHNQRYYLMARNEHWKNLAYYRLDRITNMKVTGEVATPISQVEGYENGVNIADLSTALPYMYTDEPERVRFIADESIVDQIIDWFGKNTAITKREDEKLEVSVRVSPMAMEHWAMQYAGHVRVISPPRLADKILGTLRETLNRYENNEDKGEEK